MKKKSIFGAFALMLSFIMIFGMSTTAFAATPETEFSIETASDEYGIAPAAYVGPVSINLSNSNTYSTTLDGRNCAYEYRISNNSTVTVTTYVDGSIIRTDNLSGSGKIDWIDMKFTGDHSVSLRFSSNSSTTIQVTLYSW